MAGRHLTATKASLDTLNLAHARVAFAATAAGSMLGVALPGGVTTADHSGAQALADLTTTQVEETSAPAAPATTEAFTAAEGEEEGDATADLVLEDQDSPTEADITVDLPNDPEVAETETPATQNTMVAAPESQTVLASVNAPVSPTTQYTYTAPATRQVNYSSAASAAVAIGRQYIGTPYRYAGATPAGFDCSGFVSYVYGRMGYAVPHSSAAIRYSGTVIPASQAQPGDIMWWPGHVAIYTGTGQLEAMNYGIPLRESPIRGGATFIRIAR